MEFIRSWVTGICGAGILISVVCAINPNSAASRIVRLCGSIILVFAVFAPIFNLKTDYSLDQFTYTKPQEQSIKKAERVNEDLKASIIEEQLTAYILQRAKQLGIDCEVSVGVKKNEQGELMPQNIRITCTESVQSKLFDLIKNECGIEPSFRTVGSDRVK